jgi:hypothetical protein
VRFAARALAAFALALLLAAPALAQALQLRAWLDRDRIALGETATLQIEVDGAIDAEPDYSPLLGDFTVTGNTSSRSMESDMSGTRVRTLYAVTLQPRRAGVLDIPALRVGNTRTTPLSLTVAPPAASPAHAGDAVFIEAEADASSPYVQQSVGYVVRLYVGIPLVSGQLEQPEPDGATLQQAGDDVRYSRELAGRRYTVIERHYLLLPERSGTLAIPGARFSGRGIGGLFDDPFGDAQRPLHATGAPTELPVRAIPAGATQPWLPLRSLALRWKQVPGHVAAGSATNVVVEAVADGATSAQLPDIELPPIAGAQVYPDPPRREDAFVDGRPQATITRSFAIVPSQAGTLRIEGPRIAWWDAGAGAQRIATLPPLAMTVLPGASPAAAQRHAQAVPAETGSRDDRGGWMSRARKGVGPWALATVAFALLWLATFAWGLLRRPKPPVPGPADNADADARRARNGLPLQRALAGGTLGDVAEALCAGAQPPVASVDELRGRLADPAQRAAVDALQAARWGGGDGTAARAALRAAFARGPRWTEPTRAPAPPLPPLYPP